MARGYPDFTGPKVGVYLQPAWAAKEGTDKNFQGSSVNEAWTNGPNILYTVPAGKTLYLITLSFLICANAEADADKNQIGIAYVYNVTTATPLVDIGGNGGGFCSLNKPIVITGGQEVQIAAINKANHAVDIQVSAQGYEV